MFHVKFFLLVVVAALTTAEIGIEPIIIQGHDAAKGQFPFYALLELDLLYSSSDCGGSLISNQWVLTAASCVNMAYGIKVTLGILRFDGNETGQKLFETTPNNWYVHPEVELNPFGKNDIALIKLPEPVEFSDVIRPVPLAISASNGMDDIAIGSGITSDDGGYSSVLQYTELKTYSRLSCLRTFPFLIFRSSIICVKGEESKSVCLGDSGGPLVTSNNFLVGVASFGSPDGCKPGMAQIFTRVPYYRDWIKRVTGIES